MPEIHNHLEWMKAALRERGSSFAKISRELKVSPSSVSHAATRRHVSRHIEQEIAKRLDRQISEIWPDENITLKEGGKQ